MASALSLSKLRSGRGLAGLAIAGVILAGGWYFFIEQTPQTSQAMLQIPAAKTAVKKLPTATTKPRAGGAQPMPTTRPVVSALAQAPKIIREEIADPLGGEYIDAANGFSIRFPDGWAVRTFSGDPWILDCGDANIGLISVGFSPCPPGVTADQLLPQAIARRIKRLPDTEMLAQGRTIVAGHKALWSKSVGPLPMTHDSPRMTRVQYIVPLGDGRVLEIRLAAPPAKFETLSPLLRQSLETFRLTKSAAGKTR
jgi:hypothetical protein